MHSFIYKEALLGKWKLEHRHYWLM